MAWVDGYTNTDFIDFAGNTPFSAPYPAALWRCDPAYYGGYPFNALFPDMPDFHVRLAKQRPYICVYDIGTPKDGFQNNGLAILCPVSCESTEDLNGMWSLTLTHPIDPEGRWQHILQHNLLRVNGQIFTIRSYDTNRNGAEKRPDAVRRNFSAFRNTAAPSVSNCASPDAAESSSIPQAKFSTPWK